jgi:hypothetical protein
MPLAAVALKQYGRNCSDIGSSTSASDEVHAPASLWYSKVLSVQHSPCALIPAVGQDLKERPEVAACVGRENARDVLPEQPTSAKAYAKPDELNGEVASWVIDPKTLAGDAERLAGSSSDDEINRSNVGCIQSREVIMQRNLWETMRQHGAGKRINLGKPCTRPVRWRGKLIRANTGADGQVPHHAHPT